MTLKRKLVTNVWFLKQVKYSKHKQMKKPRTPKLQDILVLASFDDNKVRQVFCSKRTREVILDLIMLAETNIKIIDKPIEGIEFNYGEQSK